MSKPFSQIQRVKTVLQQPDLGRYAAFREALRILIPYVWRRRAVSLVRSRLGLKNLIDWAAARTGSEKTSPPVTVFRHGDACEGFTLLPHIPPAEVETILSTSPEIEQTSHPDVICFSIVDWSFRFQRPQQLMSQFADHGHRVFYISISRYRSPYASPRFSVNELRKNVFEIEIASRSPIEIFSAVVEGKDAELAIESLDELRRVCNINQAIGYVMIPSWGGVALEAGKLWGWQIVYDCMDEWENFPGIHRPLLEMEQELARECDLLVVTAQKLYDKWGSLKRPAVLARNAVDFDFFSGKCKPNDLLNGIKHPVIGYFGAIADWFDTELLADIARHRPDLTFVLIGGIFDVDVSKLQSLPNVRLLGQQPYETMPQYLYHFDACLIPFKINKITEATDPVKFYEYLSGGKPVVSVDLPELAPYRDYVYLAGSADNFVEMIDRALTEDTKQQIERRKALASRHTWAERYRSIYGELAQMVPLTSIIIVTYNNLALTKLCLTSIFRNTEYPNYEVIVIDNNSADETPAYLQAMASNYPNLKIILNQENYGFAKANNQGLAIASGDFLVLLNNDTIVPQGWLSRLLNHLDDPEIGLVGPVTNFVGNEAKIDVNYRTWAEMEFFALNHTWIHHQKAADIHMLAMFCVAMRREVFEKVGYLDERFGIGMFEDDDYSIRIKNLGFRLICAADVFVHHFGQAAFGKLIRSGAYDQLFDENRAKFEEKWEVTWVPHQNVKLTFKPHPRGFL